MELTSSESDLSTAVAVELGGVTAIDLQIDGDVLSFLVQGAPEPGAVDLLVDLDGDVLRLTDAFTYAPPLDPRFDRMAAFGASFTQGVQDGVPNYHGALFNPALQTAKQLGAFLPVPALKPGLLPVIEIEDLGPPPDCVAPDPEAHARREAASILSATIDPDTQELRFDLARVDPTLEVRDLAVGGTDLEDMLHGTDSFNLSFMSHMVYDPFARPADPLIPQLDLIEEMAPTLIVSSDTYGNDIISAILGDDGIDPTDVTRADKLLPAIDELVDRLVDTGAECFVANVPRPSLLPAAAAPHGTIHVVDLFTEFDGLVTDGVTVGDQTLTAERYGGIVTLDGLHFTDTGYALLANFFLDAIEAELGVSAPRIDLESVIDGDRRSPANLVADGFDASACGIGP